MSLSDKIIFNNGEVINGIKTGAITTEDVKEFIKKDILKVIDEVADKTDIWDSERWNGFRRILRKEIKQRAGEKLI